MKIYIETIPHKNQRYETVGDWWFTKKGDLEIRVSDMGNEDYEYLIASHELDEAYLCRDMGVNEKQVTEFDEEFEKKRKKGNVDEPGDDPNAPYFDQHFIATTFERLRAQALGIFWPTYNEAVNKL